ncbi:50S ribosomal protein L31 [compost metagenome]
MKTAIQPKYFSDSKIKCACGNIIETGSVKSEMKVDTCSNCHPFFTGQKQSISNQGRAAKFMEKYSKKN